MRLALAFITLVPLPLAFTGRPIFIIVTYTIVGSLFVPFLAATLLYLNNKVAWTSPVPKNHWSTNVLLRRDPGALHCGRRAGQWAPCGDTAVPSSAARPVDGRPDAGSTGCVS
ncbi:MAG: hypothetical protein R2712_22970 [Vicinamibacterales bacterium]